MMDRNIYSPRPLQGTSPVGINFHKSPQKYVCYDSPAEPLQYSLPNPPTYYPTPRNFDIGQKQSDEALSLRQTMGSKKPQRLIKRHTFQFNDPDQKGNKLNDFLRQTVSYKSTRSYTDKFASALTSTNQDAVKKDEFLNSFRTLRTPDAYKVTESKSSINLFEGQKSIDQCELINQKIDRNKKLIQQLRKGPKQMDKDHLRNMYYKSSPYIELDREKQTDDNGFRKKKSQQTTHFMTPKLDKGTYDTRFNASSPFVSMDDNKEDTPFDPVLTSFKPPSPLKRVSLNPAFQQSESSLRRPSLNVELQQYNRTEMSSGGLDYGGYQQSSPSTLKRASLNTTLQQYNRTQISNGGLDYVGLQQSTSSSLKRPSLNSTLQEYNKTQASSGTLDYAGLQQFSTTQRPNRPLDFSALQQSSGSPLKRPFLNNTLQQSEASPSRKPSVNIAIQESLKRPSLNVLLPQLSLIDQFELGKKLGEGKFGCVNLAIYKKTNGLFALKKIPKALIKSHMMIDQLALQIRLQSCLNHKNILGMYGFFDDKTHLYIVLEYMNGGTLYEKLKKGKVAQNQAAAIVRQITQSIQYLHDMGIAHRDLKPENIVISNNVYKLCDFGWAAMCNQRRKTYCGTFDYVAPQILEGVEYDMTVDLWCLGVMTYELMTGKAPFYHISRKETMKRILNVENQNIVYPQGMSDEARDFIDKLIRKNPLERIKASQALFHPFLKDAEADYD